MVEINNLTTAKLKEDLYRRVVKKSLEEIGRNEDISLVFVGENRMRRINKESRGKNRITDVLSFPHKVPAKSFSLYGNFSSTPGGESLLGEIVICVPRAKKQARQARVSVEEEISRLLIHGVLHLSGYDHERSKKEAEEMENAHKKIEEKIWAKS